MISPNGKMEPLSTLLDLPDRYELLIDMPLGDERSLTVGVYKRILKVKMSLKEPLIIGDYEVREYVKIFKIPEDAEEEYEVIIKNVNGPVVIVIFPKMGRP